MQSMEMGPGARLVEVIQPPSIKAGRLGTIAAFAGLARPDLELAAGLLTETLVEQGARMAVQGRPCRKLWVILEGEALVSADARPIRVARQGDLVGLAGMLYASNSPETATALSSIRAFAAGPAEFRRLIEHRPIRRRLAAAAKTRGSYVSRGSGAQRRDHVGKDVVDLVPHGQKNHYDDDRNKNQDQRVLDHSLTSLSSAGATGGSHQQRPPFARASLRHGDSSTSSPEVPKINDL